MQDKNNQKSEETQNITTCELFEFCTIPQAISFTQSNSDDDYCTTGEDAACVIEIIQKNRMKKDCEQPCHTIDYSYSKMMNSLPTTNQGVNNSTETRYNPS